jgi:EAL domain-containing protein (putative c-di-GMP-specific phosphodiesterase class I)
VDEVKIDGLFVHGMATDPGDLTIVRTIVDLARHFELRVVAEGVENERTLSLRADMGCDVGKASRSAGHYRTTAWKRGSERKPRPNPTATGEVRRPRAAS